MSEASIETIMDVHWFGYNYPLKEIFLHKRKIKGDKEWLCVSNRDRNACFLVRTEVALAAKRITAESSRFGHEILFVLPLSAVKFSY